jgi:hypothetical protein
MSERLNIGAMSDDEIMAASTDAPIEGGAFVSDDPDEDGEGIVVGVPGPIWAIEGGRDAYVALWARQARSRVLIEDPYDPDEEYERDFVHVHIPIDRIDAVKDALDRAVADVRRRLIPGAAEGERG